MRGRQRVRSRSTGELEPILRDAAFRANLSNGISCSRGHGVPVFVRATTAWDFDNEGKLITVPSGAARFRGARMVMNLFSGSTDDLSDASWSSKDVDITPDSVIAPDGTMGMDLVVPNATGTTHYINKASAVTSIAGNTYVMSVYAKPAGYDLLQLAFSGGQVAGDPRVNFNLSSGTITISDAGVSGVITPLSDGVYRVSATVVAAGTSITPLVVFAINSTASRLATFAGDGTSGVCVWGAQLENVTGQADTSPSEYVPLGERQNWLTYTNDFNQWTKSNVTVTGNSIANPIDGVVNATKIECASTAATNLSLTTSGAARQDGMNYSLYVKKGSGTADANKFLLRNATTATVLVSITFDYDSGAVTILAGNASAVDVGNGWWKLTLWSASGWSNGDNVNVYTCFSGGAETANEYAYVYAPQLVRGITEPSTYFPVGATYDPYGSGLDSVRYFTTHKDGTAIDPNTLEGVLIEGSRQNNCRYNRKLTVGTLNGTKQWESPQRSAASELVTNGTFPTDTSGWNASQSTLSVVSGAMRVTVSTNALAAYGRQAITTEVGKMYTAKATLVTDGTGAAMYFYVGTAQGSNDLGYATYSTPGELTFAFVATGTTTHISVLSGASGALAGEYTEWDNISVKESVVQPVLTATGIDNAVNSASTITAIDTNATITQLFSTAAAARTFSAYVKRRTGSGTISITRDGGTSWTDVTAQINSTTYTRVAIKNTSVLNPIFGFRISTNGDAIDVDYCQDEAGAFTSSPILTASTSVTRNSEALTYPTAGNFFDSEGSLVLTQTLDDVGNNSTVYPVGTLTGLSPCYKGNSGGFVGSSDGTTPVFGSAWATDLSSHKAVGTWATGSRKYCLDGGAVGSSALYDGSFNATGIYIGVAGSAYLHGYVKNVIILKRALTDAEMQSVTG